MKFETKMPLPIIIFDLPSGRQKYTTRTIVCSIAMKLKGEWGLSPEIDSLCSILSINTIVIVIAFSFQPKTLIQEAKYEMWILEIQLVWLLCSTDVEQTSLATDKKKKSFFPLLERYVILTFLCYHTKAFAVTVWRHVLPVILGFPVQCQ